MISASDELDLVTALHAGPGEDPVWSTFLVRLRRRLRADSARILLAPAASAAEAVEILSRPESSQVRRGTAAGDPLAATILEARLRSQRVYALRELAEGNAAPVAPLPQGLALRLAHGALDFRLVLTRREAFAAGESALVAALVPHLAIALEGHWERERARLREHLSGAWRDRLDCGWVALDADGRIVDADARAAALIRDGDLLGTGPGGALVTASASANRRLAAALVQARRCVAVAEAMRIAEAPPLDMVLKTLPGADAASGAILAVHLQQPGAGVGKGSAAALAALFGLAPREARLALVLADGAGIADAAARLGLSLETARNYSKSLYAKLGVRGQAELARLVARSVAMLAG